MAFSQFKKTFESGQHKLKEMAISKKRPPSPSNIAKTNTKIVSEAEASNMSILPDLDCEVDEGESVFPVLNSKSAAGHREKAEAGDDEKKEEDDSTDSEIPGANATKHFLTAVHRFLYQARVFVRLG
jgi:hypothetical protein